MITGQTVKNTYQGDGVNREFTITFEFTDSSQIKFKVNGQEVTTNFALNTVAKTLTYPTVASELDPLTSADEIVIYRDTAITQDIEFNNGGPLNAKMIEDGLDKLTMISQELKNKVTEKTDVTELPEGTDIDGILDTGVYFVKNPTSSIGMPIADYIGSPANGSYAIIRVTRVDETDKGTYLSYQEMALIWQHTGVSSIDKPQVYSRYLTDYSYADKGWRRNSNGLTRVRISGITSATIDAQTYAGCLVLIGSSSYVLPSSAITSLTITNSYDTGDKTIIVFKAGAGFTLNKDTGYWLGEEPTFTQGSVYKITIEDSFLKCEEVVTN
jgi:hypothetical protein